MAAPTISLNNLPNVFAPVNGPIWFKFLGTFSGTTTVVNTSNLIANLNILNQGIHAIDILETAGQFKIPIRDDGAGNNVYIFDPSKILQSYVTVPYNSKPATASGTTASGYYVNEDSGFGIQLAPDKDSVVKYNINYGIQYNPSFTFDYIVSGAGPTTSTSYMAAGVSNIFCSVGDVVSVQMYSYVFSFWTATASVLGISVVGSDTILTTDQSYTLIPGSTSSASGIITSVTHMVGNTKTYYGYNGTRQYSENNVDFGNIYVLAATTSTVPLKRPMTDFGLTYSNPIPIRPGQGERVRFLTDFWGDTGYKATSSTITIEESLTPFGPTISSVSYTDSTRDYFTGETYSYVCYSVPVFDKENTIVSVTDGHYYKVTIQMNSVRTELWYIGWNPCSLYDNVRIKYLNRQGSWQYFNFNKDNKQTTNINKIEYRRPLEYDYNINPNYTGFLPSSSYNFSKLRGQAILSSNIMETFTLNSDWITEAQSDILTQLSTSPEVYVFYDSYTDYNGATYSAVSIPIIVTDNSYVHKTVNRERIFNYTLSYKYAFDTKVQNQ